MAASRDLWRAPALLQSEFQIDLEERADGVPDAVVAGPYGPVSVDHAVSAWLETSDAAAFRDQHPDPGAGEYSQAMADLRMALH
jgi:hypothetical protein